MKNFELFSLARIIHVLCVIIWIGGVAMVTTIIIPGIKKNTNQFKTFEEIEGAFSLQAKIATLLTGISGFYMLYVLNAWDRYFDYKFWWIHAMTIIWLLFSIILFIIEPFIAPKLFKKNLDTNPEFAFSVIHKIHWALLILSLITTAGAVGGSHGLF